MTVGLILTALRLHRAQIVVTGVFLALLIAVAAVHGSLTATFIAHHRDDSCLPANCADLVIEIEQRYQLVGLLVANLGLLPAAIGAFWGAPLLGREFETGTTRFAWTQSVSRRSWTLTGIITLGFLVALGGLVVGTVVSHWLAVFRGLDLPVITDNDNSFGQVRGAEPLGWWLFGFSVGTASGALLRRTVPAMVTTVAVVVAAVIGRNLLLGALASEQATEVTQLSQQIVFVALVVVSLLLAMITVVVVDRARV